MSSPYYVPEDTDIVGLFRMVCPDCGATVGVHGNAMGVFIADHNDDYDADCPSSSRKVLPGNMRPASTNEEPHRSRTLMSVDDNPQWSREVEALITRATKAGYVLRPRGVAPYGWLLIHGSEIILEGVFIHAIREELDRRNI